MKFFALLLSFFLFYGCEKANHRRNLHLPEMKFSKTIIIDLPQYNGLKTPLTPVEVLFEGVGLRGVIVIRTGANEFQAWERACPNQSLEQCLSPLRIIDPIKVQCPCDSVVYNLVNGSAEQSVPYPLLNYRVALTGNKLTIYN